jgi:tetratricopeptide (TPR) repeat protein
MHSWNRIWRQHDVATSLNDLALLYRHQGNYVEAEPLLRQALSIREKALGLDHPDVATSLNNLAKLYYIQGRFMEAESLYERARAIRENALGPNHPDVAESLNNLGELYASQGQYTKAELMYQRALAIFENALGPEHPHVAACLENYASLLRTTNRSEEAEALEARARAIRAKNESFHSQNIMGHYIVEGASLEDINAELDVFWEELKRNEALRTDVKAKGIALEELTDRARTEVIDLKLGNSHFDPSTLAIFVAYGPTVNAVAFSLWNEFALPWLLKKFGKKGIQPSTRA